MVKEYRWPWGKIVGVVFGCFILPPLGIILGLILGHVYDVRRRQMPTDKKSQQLFIRTLFQILGFIAKADGQVNPSEIAFAKQVMIRLHLSEVDKELAMKSFYQGKAVDFNWETGLTQFKSQFGGASRWSQWVINFAVQIAFVNGSAPAHVRDILQDMARFLDLQKINFSYFDTILNWQQAFEQARQQYQNQGQSSSGQYSNGSTRFTSPGLNIDQAYRVLGLAKEASMDEVKKAYRKLMSQYHPDKLMSKGLSEKEMEAATAKVQKIKAAYEQICAYQGK